MPRQETFFKEQAGNKRVEVIKTYDTSYAHEVFHSMDEQALRTLAAALEIAGNYDPGDIPDSTESEYEDFLWEELLQAGVEDVRLDPNVRSFFVVSRNEQGRSEDLYVCADWPSAESVAKKVLATSHS